MEVLHRYSNFGHLVKPLVKLLEEINSIGSDCNKPDTSEQGASAYGEGVGLEDPEARSTLREQTAAVRQTQRRLSRNEIAMLVARYRAGGPVKELAAEFGVERRTVSAILRREGVELRPRGLDSAQVNQAVVLYKQGWSLARIGDKLGVSAGTVQARLNEHGVRLRDTHGRER